MLLYVFLKEVPLFLSLKKHLPPQFVSTGSIVTDPVSIFGVLVADVHEPRPKQPRLHERLVETLRKDAPIRRRGANSHETGRKVSGRSPKSINYE